MSGLAFFDTNILIYADDALSPEKHARAIELFTDHQRRDTAVISLQVLQEYYATVTRKLGFDAELAQRKVEMLARGNVVRFEAREPCRMDDHGIPQRDPREAVQFDGGDHVASLKADYISLCQHFDLTLREFRIETQFAGDRGIVFLQHL